LLLGRAQKDLVRSAAARLQRCLPSVIGLLLSSRSMKCALSGSIGVGAPRMPLTRRSAAVIFSGWRV
jgi:hypothetical protein